MSRAHYFHALRVGQRFHFTESRRGAPNWIKVNRSQAAMARRAGGPALLMLPLITVGARQLVEPVRAPR